MPPSQPATPVSLDGQRAGQLVTTAMAWRAAAGAMAKADRIAVDLEADGFHRYPEHISLIQVALPDETIFLLDPLALKNLAPLGDLLADPAIPKVFHSADYDLRSLDRDFGYVVRGLYDTSIAAQFCGATRTGLGNVLAEFVDVLLDKPKRLQRLDWSIRPLPADALAYAAGDVSHLFALADRLAERIAELGRTEWVAEECRRLEQVHFVPPDPPALAFLAMKGARDLSPAGRAVLRELFVFREEEALRRGRPPFHVLSNDAMTALASHPEADPHKVPGVSRLPPGSLRRLQLTLERGAAGDPIAWPASTHRNPWTPEARDRLTGLKAWRTREAAAIELDAGVVWPANHLEQLALNPTANDLRSCDLGRPLPWVREWQWGVLGASLEAFWEAKRVGGWVVRDLRGEVGETGEAEAGADGSEGDGAGEDAVS